MTPLYLKLSCVVTPVSDSASSHSSTPCSGASANYVAAQQRGQCQNNVACTKVRSPRQVPPRAAQCTTPHVIANQRTQPAQDPHSCPGRMRHDIKPAWMNPCSLHPPPKGLGPTCRISSYAASHTLQPAPFPPAPSYPCRSCHSVVVHVAPRHLSPRGSDGLHHAVSTVLWCAQQQGVQC